MNTLTQERIKELFIFDGTNLINRVNRGRAKAGDIAGYVNPSTGYRVVGVEGRVYMAAHITHLYTTGSLPIHIINHLPPKNSVAKQFTRPATYSEAFYYSKMNKRNTTGVRGVIRKVSKTTGRITYVARAGHESRIYLGTYDTLEYAANARKSWENLHHPEFISGKYPDGLPPTYGTSVANYINRLTA